MSKRKIQKKILRKIKKMIRMMKQKKMIQRMKPKKTIKKQYIKE